jgi:hypothetical protein
VTLQGSWQWVNDAKPGAQQPKWGWASATPGDELLLHIKPSSGKRQGALAPLGEDERSGRSVTVGLGMLTSWHGVGDARVSCSGGCTCLPETFHLNVTQQVPAACQQCYIVQRHAAMVFYDEGRWHLAAGVPGEVVLRAGQHAPQAGLLPVHRGGQRRSRTGRGRQGQGGFCKSLRSIVPSQMQLVCEQECCCLQVTSLMVSEDERAETSRLFTVLNTTDAEGNNSG